MMHDQILLVALAVSTFGALVSLCAMIGSWYEYRTTAVKKPLFVAGLKAQQAPRRLEPLETKLQVDTHSVVNMRSNSISGVALHPVTQKTYVLIGMNRCGKESEWWKGESHEYGDVYCSAH